MATSPRLGITYIEEGEEGSATFADCVNRFEQVAAPLVNGIEDAPASGFEVDGYAYIVGTGSGAWAGQDDAIAFYADGWHFITPVEGMQVVMGSLFEDGQRLEYNGSNWNGVKGHQTLTDGATVNWDVRYGTHARVTLGGNRTLAQPTLALDGVLVSLRVIQDGTGGRTLTWDAAFQFAGGSPPTLSSGAGDVDLITFLHVSGVFYEVSRSLDVS